jgi:hypothetical protein
MKTTTIVFAIDVANRRRGDVVDIDDGSAHLLIITGYATVHDRDAQDSPTPNRRRSRTVTSGVGDDPRSGPAETGTS